MMEKSLCRGHRSRFLLRWTTLKKYRLDVPQVTLLAHELRKAGVDLPECVLSTEELVKALCQ